MENFFAGEKRSIRKAISMSWCRGLFLPRCRILYVPLWNFITFLLAHFSGLLKSPLWQHRHLVYPLSFPFTTCRFARMHSVPSSRPLITILNTFGPNIDPWDIHKPAEGVVGPIIQVINEDPRQYWPQYPVLWHTTCNLPPTRIWALQAHLLSQFSIHLTVHLHSLYFIRLWG